MRSPEQTAVGMLVTGLVMAALGGLVWLASQLDGQDWFRLVLGALVLGLLCYGRACLRAIVGIQQKQTKGTKTGASLSSLPSVKSPPLRASALKDILR